MLELCAKRILRKKAGRKTLPREEARRLQRIRAARASHKSLRLKGIKLCSQAFAARMEAYYERQALKKGQSKAELRSGSSNLDGV